MAGITLYILLFNRGRFCFCSQCSRFSIFMAFPSQIYCFWMVYYRYILVGRFLRLGPIYSGKHSCTESINRILFDKKKNIELNFLMKEGPFKGQSDQPSTIQSPNKLLASLRARSHFLNCYL